jgi:hemerythrin
MPLLEWDKGFELGIEQFDEHHKHLVALLNKTYDDFTCGANHEALEEVLDELADYATYHFSAEETWMGVHEYPDLGRHREEHNRFSGRVAEIRKDFQNGRANLSLEVLTFLRNWLIDHILEKDADYGRFVKGLANDKQG